MAAILASLGFTFLIDRMTEVLTPDIYIELTGPRLLQAKQVLAGKLENMNIEHRKPINYFLFFSVLSSEMV